MAAAAPWIDGAQPVVLAATHLAALAALLRWTARLDSGDPAAVAVFYQRVWKLFFAEYVLVPAACLLG
jgi:homogentisate phytyltransferase/homogentisate geranylgeranyltransferase